MELIEPTLSETFLINDMTKVTPPICQNEAQAKAFYPSVSWRYREKRSEPRQTYTVRQSPD